MFLKPRTLFAKLALTYVIIVSIAGYLYVQLFLFLWEEYLGAVEESTQWEVASNIEKELRPLLHPAVDAPKLEEALFRISQINPKIDVYVLDADGTIRYFLGQQSGGIQVDTKPIETFLTQKGYPSRAILGTTPHSEGSMVKRALFSASRTTVEGKPGYVYVVLDGHRFRNLLRALGDFSVVNASLIYAMLFSAITALIGMSAFYYLTKRFREMTLVVQAFKEGDYSQRIPETGDDEVSDHGKAFNEMADRLVDTIQALENSDRLRRELIANVSHDVRAPVSAIHSLLETFQMKYRSMTEEEHEEFLGRAIANCRALQSLISDLFELSKLNAASETIDQQPVHLEEVLQDICVKYEPLTKERGIQVEVVSQEDLPPVLADSKLLNRAVSNLVENAVRYSNPGGQVILRASASGSVVTVKVEDNGIGIEAEDLPHVFDRFYRAESGKKKNQRGTGLGLAIAKRIIDLHGHRLQVSSISGEGTTFSFDLHSS